tara:strand:- start:389 stop:694 length:306 start_codon:yes stop_codon:yes gene_type:complete
MITKFNAVHALVGGQISGPTNGPISEYKFRDGQKPPTESEVNAKLKQLEDEYEKQAYARARSDSYDPIPEQLDMQYWDKVNGTNKWQEAVAKVKADNPRPK